MVLPHMVYLRRLRDYVRRSDWPVIPIALGIMGVGLLIQWSVSGPEAFPSNHLLRLGVALAACLFAAAVPARWWRNYAYLFYAVCLLLLLYVLFTGRATNNARRWIDLVGGFKLQPSEFMKLALLLCLARWYSDRRRAPPFQGHPGSGGPVLGAFLLVLAEPDLGTALTFLPLFLAMTYLAGTRRRVFLSLILVP